MRSHLICQLEMKAPSYTILLASAALVQGFSKGGSRTDGTSRENAISPGWILEFANGGTTAPVATKGGSSQSTTVYPTNALPGSSPELFTSSSQLPGSAIVTGRPLEAATFPGVRPAAGQLDGSGSAVSTYVGPSQTYQQPQQALVTSAEIASLPQMMPTEVIRHHYQYPAPASSVKLLSPTIALPSSWAPSPWAPTPYVQTTPTWPSMPGSTSPTSGNGNLSGINAELLTYLLECIKHSDSHNSETSSAPISPAGWSPMPVIMPVPIPAPMTSIAPAAQLLPGAQQPQFIQTTQTAQTQPLPEQIMQQLPQTVSQQMLQPASQQQQQQTVQQTSQQQIGQQQQQQQQPQQQILQQQQQQPLQQIVQQQQQQPQQQVAQTAQRIQATGSQQMSQVPQQIVRVQSQPSSGQVQQRPQQQQQQQPQQIQSSQQQQAQQQAQQQIQSQQIHQQPQSQQMQSQQQNQPSLPMLPGVHQQSQRATAPSTSPTSNRLPGMPTLLEINQQLQNGNGQKTG